MNEPLNTDRFKAACETYGLHPFVALSLFAIDQMLFAGELASGFLLTIVSIYVGMFLVIPVTLIQRNAYKDDAGTALAKALLCCLLTAIPTSLPSVFTGAWGIAGVVGLAIRRQRERDNTTNHYGDN